LCLLWDRHFPSLNLGARAYRTIALRRIDRTVERYWHWKLELNYEGFAQERVTDRQR
jgi:hypothetical protein